MKRQGKQVTGTAPAPPGGGLDSLRKIESAEQRLWLLALLLFLLVTLGLLLMDATSLAFERMLSGMTSRLRDILSNYGASIALAVVVVMIFAYFREKLVVVRHKNRELVRALQSSAHILAQRNSQLETWHQLSHKLVTQFNLPSLLDLIVRTAAEVTEADCAAVILADRRSRHLRLAAVHQRGLEIDLARRVAARVTETGESVWLSCGSLPEELDRQDLSWEDLASLAGAPLLASDTIRGALLVGRLTPREAFSREVMDVLQSFAGQASLALEKANLYAENQRQLDRLGEVLDDLRSTQERLRESEKLYGLGAVAEGLAQVIGNPLGVVLARAGALVESDKWDADEVRAEVAEIREQTGRAAATLEGFLKLSRRIDSGALQWVDLNAVVRQALDVMRHEFRASEIEVLESYGEVPEVQGHPLQLEQALVSLLLSARQAMRSGSKLMIQTSALEARSASVKIEGRGRRRCSRAARDTGMSSAASAAGQYEADLGLTAVERIVRWHRGYIETGCQPGELLRFEIRLPLPPPEAQSSSAGAPDLRQEPRAGVAVRV